MSGCTFRKTSNALVPDLFEPIMIAFGRRFVKTCKVGSVFREIAKSHSIIVKHEVRVIA